MCIFGVLLAESPSGRFGYILKENTLENILQDQYLQKMQLYRAHIPRDGNCLFRAFAQGLFFDQSQQEELRRQVVKALDENWAMFEQTVTSDKTTYLSEMAQSATYGGEPEIKMLCLLYKVQAKVYLGGLNYSIQRRVYGTEYASDNSVIHLIYISDGRYDSGHYDLVVNSMEQSDEAEEVYKKWRQIRIRELQSWAMYEDHLTYGKSWQDQLTYGESWQDQLTYGEFYWQDQLKWQLS